MIARIQPEKAAGGEVTLPASKSLSHRAILAASLANGVSVLHHSGTNKDILATRKAMEHFGVRFEEVGNDLYVYGNGKLQYDGEVIDCNESGACGIAGKNSCFYRAWQVDGTATDGL